MNDLPARNNIKDVNCETIYSLQGTEKDTIIFLAFKIKACFKEKTKKAFEFKKSKSLFLIKYHLKQISIL